MRTHLYTVDDCRLIDFSVTDIQGNGRLANPFHCNRKIPFEIKRMYYISNIPLLKVRGGHAHKDLQQIVIALRGLFSISLHDGCKTTVFHLNNPGVGLHLMPGIWRDVFNFAGDALCLVLASELYNENDYIRNYDAFIQYRNGRIPI